MAIIASYPCRDLSSIGNTPGTDRCLEILLENVHILD